jgi:sulfur carrier protein ThiS
MTDVWEAGNGGYPSVTIKVNGETVGSADGEDTLADVAKEYSANHGLRTFNVLVNGSKAEVSAGSQTLAALRATVVELVAKDARG